MRKSILTILGVAGVTALAGAGVTVKLPEGAQPSYIISHGLVSDGDLAGGNSIPTTDTITVKNGVLAFDITDKGAASYYIPFSERERVGFYCEPGDNITVNVTSLSPLEYTVSGNAIMDGIYEMKPKAMAVVKKSRDLSAAGQMTDEAYEQLNKEYTSVFTDFIKNNPTSPAAIYALINLSGDEFLTYFDNLPESLKGSAYYPLAESKKKYVDREIAAEKKIEALQSGDVDAPGFTFKNLEGKDVSLSEFKGKWVILDFWGGWCPWCIKGFPKLKDAYEQYQPELEIIGIDCNESEDAWRKAVAKYELPWVNVYNPDRGGESGILADYGVQGFPTKVIISPEGKIADITVGENPEFFEVLAKLINGKK